MQTVGMHPLAAWLLRGGPLPAARSTLGALAEKCHAYAKALHYKELEFQASMGVYCTACGRNQPMCKQPWLAALLRRSLPQVQASTLSPPALSQPGPLHPHAQHAQSSPHTAVEALISINNQLRQPDAAVGVLNVAQKELHMDLKESW